MQYSAARVVLRRPSDGRILLLKRTINDDVAFEPVGGRVEANFALRLSETFEECAIREAQEELNLKINITHYLGSYYFFWSIRDDTVSQCVLFMGDIVEGEPNNVQQDGCGELDYAWVSFEDIRSKKIPIRDYHVGLYPLLLKASDISAASHRHTNAISAS